MNQECNYTMDERKVIERRIDQTAELMSVAETQAKQIVSEILNHTKGKMLSFTDDEDGENFYITIPNNDGEQEEHMVNSVFLKEHDEDEDEIMVIADNNEEYHLWEAKVDIIVLLYFMRDELYREMED